MVCTFMVPVVGNYETVLTLPPCYELLRQKHKLPGRIAYLSKIGSRGWWVDIVKEGNTYSITGGWKYAAPALNLRLGDLIIFKFVDAIEFNMEIIRIHIGQDNSEAFNISFTTDTQCKILSSEHLTHHFENKNLDKPFTLRFGTAKWLVRVEKRSDVFYLTDGWEKVFEDLKLQVGDSLVFTKVNQTTFTIQMFLQDGTGVQPNDNDSNNQDELIYIYSDESDTGDHLPINNSVVETCDDPIEQHHQLLHQNEPLNAATDSDDDIPVNESSVDPNNPPLNVTANKDPTIVRQLTHKFRFPTCFSQDAEFVNGAEIEIQFADGNIIKENIRAERSGTKVRFAICKWATCMQKLGIRNGGRYRLKYYKSEGLLAIYND